MNNPKTFPIILQSKMQDGFQFFRRIHADGRVEKKLLGGEWESNDCAPLRPDRIEKHVATMTARLGWKIVS